MSLRPTSLRARLILGALLVLAIFLTAAGVGQERAFRAAALSAEQDKLRGLIYALLGATEPSARGGLVIGDFDLPDPRLTQPDSGLAAWLLTLEDEVVWRSPSALHAPPEHGLGEVGDFHFEETPEHFLTTYHLRWIGTDAEARRYQLLVESSKGSFQQQLTAYRRQLLGWLLAAAAGLLITLMIVLAWLIQPVRRMARELRAVERGDTGELAGRYPDELRPLAVLDGMLREGNTDVAQTREQVERMRHITEHQLARASHAGRRTLARPQVLAPVVDKIASSMAKVYHDKAPQITQDVPQGLNLRVEEGDLFELVGNILDNACKWCEQAVAISSERDGGSITITVEDDGPGFPEDAQQFLKRGQRADQRTPGQGLGLATVKDLVDLYEGSILIDRSRRLGGARLVLRLRA